MAILTQQLICTSEEPQLQILKPGDEIVCIQSLLNFFSSVCIVKMALNLLSKFQVDLNNLEEYISAVVDATVKSGIVRQMEAFRAGFNQVIG